MVQLWNVPHKYDSNYLFYKMKLRMNIVMLFKDNSFHVRRENREK